MVSVPTPVARGLIDAHHRRPSLIDGSMMISASSGRLMAPLV